MKKNKESLIPTHRLGVEIMEAFNMLNDKATEFFGAFDVTPQQYNVIAILYTAGPLSTSDILEWMFEKNAGVSRLVDRLVKKGLAIKNQNTKDRRLVKVDLTDSGKCLYNTIGKVIYKLDNHSVNLTEEEVQLLISLLTKLNAN